MRPPDPPRQDGPCLEAVFTDDRRTRKKNREPLTRLRRFYWPGFAPWMFAGRKAAVIHTRLYFMGGVRFLTGVELNKNAPSVSHRCCLFGSQQANRKSLFLTLLGHRRYLKEMLLSKLSTELRDTPVPNRTH